MKGFKMLSVLGCSVLLMAACAGKQIRENQKENFNLQMSAYTAQAATTAALATAAMKACEKDANPGLCADSVVEEFTRGMPRMPAQPVPYVSPVGKVLVEGLRTFNTGLNLFAGYKRDQNIVAMLDSVGQNSGTHVQGNFINGHQDNSVDNSIDVGGNLGDSYGDNFTGGNREENNESTEFNGQGPILVDSSDVTIGNQNRNSGNIGEENRQESDGDFDNDTDNSNDGDDCVGESCNPVEQPGG